MNHLKPAALEIAQMACDLDWLKNDLLQSFKDKAATCVEQLHDIAQALDGGSIYAHMEMDGRN